MKKFLLFITTIFLFSAYGNIYAAGNIVDNIIVTGVVNAGPVTSGNGGKLVFPDTPSGVHVQTNNIENNSGVNFGITGDFWLSETSNSTDLSTGWATFDIGTVAGANKVVLTNNGTDNLFTFNGYAWSNAAGWIYFGNTGVAGGTVTYNRTSGIINGCAWSENLGWICLDFTLDTTPPDISAIVSKPTAANHNKPYTFSEDVTVLVENYYNTAMFNHSTFSTNHNLDVRKVKFYDISVTDRTGNISTGELQIVASVPSMTGFGLVTASEYTNSSVGSKIGDGADNHNISLKIRDTYGNDIINAYDGATKVKDVQVSILFNNNVDLDQISNDDFGDAIRYTTSGFSSMIYLTNQGIGYNASANYSVDIMSFAPSKSGYSFTTNNNDISVNNLTITVTAQAGYSGVGEIVDVNNTSFPGTFSFTPLVEVDGIVDDGEMVRDYYSEFTTSVSINNKVNTKPVNNLEFSNILDVMKSGSYYNTSMSFQSFTGVTGGTASMSKTCEGYTELDTVNLIPIYYTSGATPSKCDESILGFWGSDLTLKDTGFNSIGTKDYKFSAMPRIVVQGLPEFDAYYSSDISYTIAPQTLSSELTVKYPSFEANLTEVENSQAKITGIVNSTGESFSVISDSSTSYVGVKTKADVYRDIHKNTAIYQKLGRGSEDTIYQESEYTFNSMPAAAIDTIIVYGANVIITNDITYDPNRKISIIALKNSAGVGGDIFIGANVQKIYAILVADKSVISGDGINYHSDDRSANKQLYIKGSIISNNTIGGSSKMVPSCPYYITGTCDIATARRYDLNHLRSYIYTGGANSVNWAGIDKHAGYDEAPVIIDFDSSINKNIPKIFRIKY